MEDLNLTSTGDVDQIVDEAPVSMDDSIRESLRAINERNAADTTDTGLLAAKPAPEAPEDAAQRIRDEQGKFAKKIEGVPADSDLTTTDATTGVPKELQTLGLRKEEAVAFAAAPEILKQAFMRRSQEMHQGVEQYRQAAQFAQTISTAMSPYAATLNSLNISADKAVGELMAADHKLRYGQPAEKVAFFQQLARNYGIDIAQAALPQEQQQQIDPNLSALQQQVQQLTGYINNQQTTAQQQKDAELNSYIANFAADKVNHSHFDAVKGHMAALLQAGQAKDLEDAYEQAVYANPTTRALMLQQQEAAKREEATKRAQAAKKAGSVNIRQRASMPATKPIGSMDDTIRDEYRRLTGTA